MHWRMAMKVIISLLLSVSSLVAQVKFDRYFEDVTLRVDLYHIGNSTVEDMTLDRLLAQGSWAGSTRNLLDPFGMGRYAVKLYDVPSNRLIYARGFDSFFGEYKTTKPAQEGTKRTFHETVLVPMPKDRVLLVIEMRDRRNIYRPMWTFEVDPRDYRILRESPQRGYRVFEVLQNGDPHDRVDLVVVGEGYTAGEAEKFERDLKRFTAIFFDVEPYKRLKDSFNIRGVLPVSPESGVDEPRQGKYRATALGLTFNSLDSDRYLLTEDNGAVRDAAGEVPYDCLLVMANMKRYGGGGIYNFLTAFTSDGTWPDYVFHHEFGHAFAGLGDEYYTTDVAYSEFYPRGVEPPDPNLTALLDKENLKWKELLTPGLPIPTEWGQRTFDSLGVARDSLARARAAKLEEMKKAGEDSANVKTVTEEFSKQMRKVNDDLLAFMEHHPMRGKIGAFEGGGYVSKGIYRPTVNSIMHQFNKSDRMFFAVSERAIERMVRWLCGE
jgi:IgA Peptidase M64/Peptidase M64 N-terminus